MDPLENTDGHMDPLEKNTDGPMDPLEKNTHGHMDPLEKNTDGRMDPLEKNTDGPMDPLEKNADGHVDPLEKNTDGHMDPLEKNTDGHLDPLEKNTGGHMDPLEKNTDGHMDLLENIDGPMDPLVKVGGRSFVEVMSEKYSPENFPIRRGPGVGLVVVPTVGPQGSPMKERLNLPSVLVLNNCGISRAGEQAEISAFCSHVVELDLSHNRLQDWNQISKIVSSIPNLVFLNLSSNPLEGTHLDPSWAPAFSGLRRLVLNNTRVPWDTVLLLTRETPRLEELFLCLNTYSNIIFSGSTLNRLRLLHITDNSLQDWTEVRKFGSMFPGLDTLVMANNNLESIQDPEDLLRRLFPNLRSINLNNTGLNCWDDIEKLNFFPKLVEVRLQGIPLLQRYTNAERRNLMIAHLPLVSLLNGSSVSDTEREDAERFFIRYHLDFPEEALPFRYHSLVNKYGRLEPLAEIDLRPRCRAQVEVHCEENVEQVRIRLDQTVLGLKKQLSTVVQMSTGSMRLYYIDKFSAFGPEEMKYNSRALHSYSIQDGDEILVVPKSK